MMRLLYWLRDKIEAILSLFEHINESDDSITFLGDNNYQGLSSFADPSSSINEGDEAESDFEKLSKELETQRKDIEKVKKDAEKTLKNAEQTKGIVYLGFVISLIMLAGIICACGFSIYNIYNSSSAGIEDNYFNEVIENQKRDIEELKNENKETLKILNCQKYKKSWQYEECFNASE